MSTVRFTLVIFSIILMTPPGYSKPEELNRLLKEARKVTAAGDLVRSKFIESEAKLNEVYASYMPKLKVETSIAPSPKATLDETSPALPYTTSNSDWSVFLRLRGEIQQVIYTFGRYGAYKRAAKAGKDAAPFAEKLIYGEQDLLVRRLYFSFVTANNAVAYLEDKLGALKDEVDKAEQKHKANLTHNQKKIDYLRISGFYLKNEALLEEIRAAKAATLYGLNQISGLPESELLQFEEDIEPEPVVEALVYKDLESALPELNPEVGIALKTKEAKQHLVTAQKRELLPILGVLAFGEYSVTPNRDDAKHPYLNDPFNSRTIGIGLGLKWNFDFFQWDSKVHQETAKSLEADAQYRIALMKARIELSRVYHQWAAAKKTLQLQDERYLKNKRITTVRKFGSSLGTSSVQDLMDAFKDQVDARKDWAEAILNLNVRGAELARLVGAKIVYPSQALDGLETP